jgi:hypothetical protein
MNTRRTITAAIMAASLAGNLYSILTPSAAIQAQEAPPTPTTIIQAPRYARQTDDCDMKYGIEHVGEGSARYMQEIMEGVIADYTEPLTPDENDEVHSHIDYNNDFLCWTPDSMQPSLIGRAQDLVFFVGETMPTTAWRLQLEPEDRRRYRP